jgi:hypothetical protein
MRRLGRALLLLSTVALAASAHAGAAFNWDALRNPVLSYPHWSIKDPSLAWERGTIYVFFSAFYQDHGRIRSHVVEVSTQDFLTFSRPILNFEGEKDGWIGMCTPDVQKLGKTWELSFNSWGDDPKRPDQLFYMTSPDLVRWAAPSPLAANLTVGQSVIGPSLTSADGSYYAAWRQGLEDFPNDIRVRFAAAKSLAGPWHYVGFGYASLRMADGKDNGLIHENYQFLRIGNVLRMLSDDYRDNVEGEYLYTLADAAQPLNWEKGFEIKVPLEGFNRSIRCQAASLYDRRADDGYFYMIYAGSNEQTAYLGRGWNRLALVRSKDLVHWFAPGSGSHSVTK